MAVGQPGLVDGVPPLRAADRVPGCLVYPVADVVVVADRIDGLVLGVVTTTQQLRVEDGLLSDCVHVQQCGEGLPDRA